MKVDINVHHLTRVEGHGNIHIFIRDGKIEQARWDVVETPRFFEAMLSGKRWENAPVITSRICGICSTGHTLASIRAVEQAFGIVPTPTVRKLRLVLKHMETLQSHILHLYFLAAPDFLGAGSVFPLIASHPDVVARAAKLKRLANQACDAIGGRCVHPVRAVVGGFTMFPEKKQLRLLCEDLMAALPEIELTAELFRSFRIPDFARQTEFVSLMGEGEYPFIGGTLVSSLGVKKAEHEYRSMTNEYLVDHSTSKWTRLSLASFAVGALARLNNNFDLLHPAAKELSLSFGLKPLNHNPFMNLVAQLVECLHVVHDSITILGDLLDSEWERPRQQVTPRSGTGVGAVEVPRGILYHAYEFDQAGCIVGADCVIPTGQNHANIQHDLEALAAKYSGNGTTDREIQLLAEMLVRAYDPCISCSVH